MEGREGEERGREGGEGRGGEGGEERVNRGCTVVVKWIVRLQGN